MGFECLECQVLASARCGAPVLYNRKYMEQNDRP